MMGAMSPRPLLLALLLAGALAPPAHAGRIVLGSDLQRNANVIESHGADSAFWNLSIHGRSQAIPEDGQVVEVRMKGTVLRERGAAPPANLIHFQSLVPEGPHDDARVWLTSQGFHLPIDRPDASSTYRPENLCVKKDGLVAFNDIGGFKWGGSLDAPLDEDHYHNGAPFEVFARVPGVTIAHYTADNGTKNSHVLRPYPVPGVVHPTGFVRHDQELLMQIVVRTGQDRSYECGGPLRNGAGDIVRPQKPAPKSLKLIAGQRPYVTRNRRTRLGIYCSHACSGTTTLLLAGNPIAEVPIDFTSKGSGFIQLRISAAAYRRLRASGRRLRVICDITLTGEPRDVRRRLTLRG